MITKLLFNDMLTPKKVYLDELMIAQEYGRGRQVSVEYTILKKKTNDPVNFTVKIYKTNNLSYGKENLDKVTLWKTITITDAYKFEDLGEAPHCNFLIFEMDNSAVMYSAHPLLSFCIM